MEIKKGANVIISPLARIYCSSLEIGDNVRIDDFCILTGNIKIGSNIHIGCYNFYSGNNGIVLEDFVQMAPRISLLSASDDFSGNSLVGPCLPDELKPRLMKGAIVLKRHVLIGTNSVVMPGVTISEGASIGAYSLVKGDCEAWAIYGGVPAKKIKERSQKMLELEKQFNNMRL